MKRTLHIMCHGDCYTLRCAEGKRTLWANRLPVAGLKPVLAACAAKKVAVQPLDDATALCIALLADDPQTAITTLFGEAPDD